MTTQELHINLDILIQKTNSNWNKSFLPQEKDFLLNREIIKFIKQRINPLSNNKKLSVFDVTKRTQDLNLLSKTVNLNIININQKEAIIELPFDYLYYIDSSINGVNKCNNINYNTISNTTYICKLKPVTIFNTLTELTITLVKNSQNIIIFDLNSLPVNYLPQDNIEDYKKVFIINNAINLILENKLKEHNIEFKFDTILQKFILKSKEEYSIIYTINDTNQTIENSTTTSIGNLIEKTFNVPIDIKDEEFKNDLSKSYLSSSNDEKIIAYLKNDNIILDKPISMIFTNATLTYFCKPQKIDLLLNYNSNFSDDILLEILDNTAKSIKGIISSDTYEKFSDQNILIE